MKPTTPMREVMLRLEEKERQKLVKWLSNDKNFIGKKIEVVITHFTTGELGTFECEIKAFKRPRKQ